MTTEFIDDIRPFFHGRPVVYVDLGAHKGRVLTEMTWGKLDVREAHLVEPNPASFSELQAIAGKARVRTLRLYNIAVGAEKGRLTMKAADTMSRVLRDDAETEAARLATDDIFEIDTQTLDMLRLNVLDRHISILKIDVEGSELDVLAGATETLSGQHADVIYIEAGTDPENRQQCYYRDIEDRLQPHGYRLFKVYEQKNEWIADSPILRRVNLAFMSSRFADNHPYQLCHDLFDAQEKVVSLEAEREATGPRTLALERELEAARKATVGAQADIARKAQSLFELQTSLAATAEAARLDGLKAAEAMGAEKARGADAITRLTERLRTADQAAKAAEAQLLVFREEEEGLLNQLKTLQKQYDDLKQAHLKGEESARKLKRLRIQHEEALALASRFEQTAVSLVAAIRKSRHDHNRELAEQRDRLKAHFSYRLGSTITKARSLNRMLALPAAIMRERKAYAGALQIEAPFPTEPPLFTAGDQVVSHAPEFARVRLREDRTLFIAGQAIGARPGKSAQLTARFRYLNASGRPLKITAPDSDSALGDWVERPVEILKDHRFQLALKNPPKAPLIEIAFIARRGDVVFLGVEAVEQPQSDTASRWLIKGRETLAEAASSSSGHRPPVVDAAEVAARAARQQVNHLKKRLLTLGFTASATADFDKIISETQNPYLRKIASWEMAVWRANRYTPEDAREALVLLDIVESLASEPQEFVRLAVLRAESQALIEETDAARRTLETALLLGENDDLHLGVTRLDETPEARLATVNRILERHGLETMRLQDSEEGVSPYDRLHAEAAPVETSARVSIIIPVFNAEATIGTALRSLLGQTWGDIEILVSDDCSTDGTAAVVERLAQADSRVRLIPGVSNSGPYVARNLALQLATGDFVTTNDSDDWSHPRKIELQARHLLANPQVIANTSPQARTNEDLVFHRRGNPGFYVQPNMSSLMFRRKIVVDAIGYWDSVRFAADSEYTRRIKAVFGQNAIVDIDCGPVMFQRQTETSLTGSKAFGYHGFKMGARREYEEGHKRFHKANAKPYIGFPLAERPFPAPAPMRPDRDLDREQRRHFDVVMVSDFRLPGGTNMSNVEEIKAQAGLGLTTGLVQMSLYHLNPDRTLNPKVAQQLDAGNAEMVVFGERVRCDLLVVRLPWVLDEWQSYIPDVEAKTVRVIVNQPPQRDYGPDAEVLCDLGRCAENLRRYFGSDGSWHPIGPLVRDALTTHHADDLKLIDLGAIWPNIIDVSEWRRPQRRQKDGKTRIVRHSRDQYVKWPNSPKTLLEVYPDTPPYEVHILGGAETPAGVLGGKLPRNWKVTEFGKQTPQRFLAKGDVFVYYTHPDWIESFGRVIFEAMAVGLPVILPPIYRELFQDAAIYAEPHEVRARIDALMADDNAYDAQVDTAFTYVERHFGYGVHAARIGDAMGRDLLSSPRAGTEEAGDQQVDEAAPSPATPKSMRRAQIKVEPST